MFQGIAQVYYVTLKVKYFAHFSFVNLLTNGLKPGLELAS